MSRKTKTTVSLSRPNASNPDQRFLVISMNEFEDGLATGPTKRGILAIDPDADPENVYEANKDKNWKLTGEPDNNGFYTPKVIKVEVKTEATAGEIVHETN